MQRADVAMYRAKAKRVGLRGLRPERGRVRRDRAEAGERAAPGADRDELVLHYQPKADLRTGAHRRRRGAHALAPPPPRA